ncbi:MAG: glycosyltransferase family 4 protein [Actinomycetota bacterium]|nr:glycosyltransferase family 4 protein [Actinomycetota bacterium]
MSEQTKLRVAMTMEQCWHRVPGGTAVAALRLAATLINSGIDLVGVAARHRGPPTKEWLPPMKVNHLALPRPVLYETWHRLRTPAVQRATGSVEVIHASTLAIPPKTAPLVVTIHDLAFLSYPDYFTRRGLRFFERGLALAIKEADLVLCSSEATRRHCLQQGFAPERLRHVPLGVDHPEVTETEVSRVRDGYGLTRRYIMWTGTIEPRKNLAGLIRAFGYLDADVDLVLVGPKGWNEDLEDLVSVGKERIKPLGFVDKADLTALYAGADVFCYPSHMEGFGFPVLEAMAQGTPVVTSLGTSTQELAAEAGVLVDPRDPQSIAGGIRAVLEDERFSEKLAAAGRTRASEYSWERTAGLVINAYRDVT